MRKQIVVASIIFPIAVTSGSSALAIPGGPDPEMFTAKQVVLDLILVGAALLLLAIWAVTRKSPRWKSISLASVCASAAFFILTCIDIGWALVNYQREIEIQHAAFNALVQEEHSRATLIYLNTDIPKGEMISPADLDEKTVSKDKVPEGAVEGSVSLIAGCYAATDLRKGNVVLEKDITLSRPDMPKEKKSGTRNMAR